MHINDADLVIADFWRAATTQSDQLVAMVAAGADFLRTLGTISVMRDAWNCSGISAGARVRYAVHESHQSVLGFSKVA